MDSNLFKLFMVFSVTMLLSACSPQESVKPDNTKPSEVKPALNSITEISKPKDIPESVIIKGIPYYPQPRNFYASATLASVLNFYGANASLENLLPRNYITAQKGTLEFDTILTARKFGFIVYPLTEDIQDIFLEISQQHPVVVSIKNPNNPDDWSLHTIYGYDFNDNTILMNSPSQALVKMSMDNFDRQWAQAQHWAITITPPDIIPASAREIGYLSAISKIEPIAPESAKKAYLKTLERWPNNIVALIGLGDIAYAHHHFKEAQNYFQEAVKINPRSGDALNNLAQTYLDLHQPQQALSTIQLALKLRSHHHRTYLMTYHKIQNYINKNK